ncbi:hypothetical protein GQ44DRAFT_763557 [Phaeosphaeriaceae sp. PMI808]|nr:hypothetical protein GQ44DRAFT_763557 [Phaeosphaeriaceae sp. PMI808]
MELQDSICMGKPYKLNLGAPSPLLPIATFCKELARTSLAPALLSGEVNLASKIFDRDLAIVGTSGVDSDALIRRLDIADLTFTSPLLVAILASILASNTTSILSLNNALKGLLTATSSGWSSPVHPGGTTLFVITHAGPKAYALPYKLDLP